ncbi:ABC transporter substrate-binding protein [Methanolacinia petrolearia]|uniref:ABC transporter substrate-binding protein n=1 Tax=Methanolacinia petrolearia TaxID=54120 RepID=UPI003BA8E4CB
MSKRKHSLILLLILLAVIIAASGCTEDASNSYESDLDNTSGYKTVTDMRGVEVTVPEDPQRVVAMSRSLIDTAMYIFGKEDRIVGCSVEKTATDQGTYVYNGTDYTVNTWIGQILNPELLNTTNVGGFAGPYGEPNAETIAKLDPDLFILRDMGEQDENTEKFIEQLDSMGIPVVVLKYPSCYENPDAETIYDEVMLLGEVFGEEEEAERIVETMRSRIDFITERTGNISEKEKVNVLYFGAPTNAFDKGGVGYAFGNGTIELALMEKIVNANNVFKDNGRNLISSEQLISLDPDKIILSTWSGYHPPRQLYDEELYGNIQEMRAIKSGEVYSLAATPCKSERLKFPVNVMIAAKAIYPERFEDIDLETWIREYIVELYGTDEETTNDIMNAFMLDYLEIT